MKPVELSHKSIYFEQNSIRFQGFLKENKNKKREKIICCHFLYAPTWKWITGTQCFSPREIIFLFKQLQTSSLLLICMINILCVYFSCWGFMWLRKRTTAKTELYSLAESTQLFIQFTSSKLNNVVNLEISELKLYQVHNKLLLIFHRIEIIWTNSNHDYCVVLKIFTTHQLKFSWFTSPPTPFPITPPGHLLYITKDRRNTMADITLHHRNRSSKLPSTHALSSYYSWTFWSEVSIIINVIQ